MGFWNFFGTSKFEAHLSASKRREAQLSASRRTFFCKKTLDGVCREVGSSEIGVWALDHGRAADPAAFGRRGGGFDAFLIFITAILAGGEGHPQSLPPKNF